MGYASHTLILDFDPFLRDLQSRGSKQAQTNFSNIFNVLHVSSKLLKSQFEAVFKTCQIFFQPAGFSAIILIMPVKLINHYSLQKII